MNDRLITIALSVGATFGLMQLAPAHPKELTVERLIVTKELIVSDSGAPWEKGFEAQQIPRGVYARSLWDGPGGLWVRSRLIKGEIDDPFDDRFHALEKDGSLRRAPGHISWNVWIDGAWRQMAIIQGEGLELSEVPLNEWSGGTHPGRIRFQTFRPRHGEPLTDALTGQGKMSLGGGGFGGGGLPYPSEVLQLWGGEIQQAPIPVPVAPIVVSDDASGEHQYAILAEVVHVVSEPTGKAVQGAIDTCAAQGGGVVCLPPGRYVSGPLWLKNNIELRLEAGATVVLSHERKDWPAGVRALVNAKGATNIAITGRGTFDGAAQWEYAPVRGQDPEIIEEQDIARRAGVEMKRYYRTGAVQKYLFVLQDAQDVRLEGVTIRNAPLWNVRLQDCNRVWIRGIYLYSDLERGVNSDGIDVVSSSNVFISDSIICTADDAICLKTADFGGRGAGTIRPIENVVVNNCILTSSSTAMMIGTETHADIRHVLFSNIIVRNANKVFGINVQDGATVSDVRFVNVTFETNRRHWNWWGSGEVMKLVLKKRTPQSRLGHIRDITIDGAQGTGHFAGRRACRTQAGEHYRCQSAREDAGGRPTGQAGHRCLGLSRS